MNFLQVKIPLPRTQRSSSVPEGAFLGKDINLCHTERKCMRWECLRSEKRVWVEEQLGKFLTCGDRYPSAVRTLDPINPLGPGWAVLAERSFWLWFIAAVFFGFLYVIIREIFTYHSFALKQPHTLSDTRGKRSSRFFAWRNPKGRGIQNDSVFQAHNKIHSINWGGRNTEQRLIAAEECKPGSSKGAAVLRGSARRGALHGTCKEIVPKSMALETFRGQRCHCRNWL